MDINNRILPGRTSGKWNVSREVEVGGVPLFLISNLSRTNWPLKH